MVLMKPNAFQNGEFERNILGYIASSKNGKAIFEILKASDFNYKEHATIYSTMLALFNAGKSIDLVSVAGALLESPENDKLDELLADCVATKICSTEWQALQYIESMKKMAFRRSLFNIFETEKAALLEDTNDAENIIESARQKLRDLASLSNYSWMDMMSVLINAHEHIEKVDKGEEKAIPTGVFGLDSFMMGLHKGELTILGARPAVGKSALGMHIALAAAEAGFKVGVCSREMTDIQYGTRVLARDVSFPTERLRKGGLEDGDWEQINDSYSHYANLDVSFTFQTSTAEDLRMEVQKKVDSNEIDFLVVDYVQLMQTKRKFEMDYQRIGYVTKMLKDMSVKFNIAILALAQVGRSSEGSMPTMAELRGSGDIEQDADNIIFMHRPSDPKDKSIDPRDEDLFKTLLANTNQNKPQYIALETAKQRQGNIGCTSVLFYPGNMTYKPIERNPR